MKKKLMMKMIQRQDNYLLFVTWKLDYIYIYIHMNNVMWEFS